MKRYVITYRANMFSDHIYNDEFYEETFGGLPIEEISLDAVKEKVFNYLPEDERLDDYGAVQILGFFKCEE